MLLQFCNMDWKLLLTKYHNIVLLPDLILIESMI